MGRIHLFEFGDMTWFPRALHEYMTDYLGFVQTASPRMVEPFAPLVEQVADAARGDDEGSRRVVDLCSGGAGPWPALLPALADREPPVEVTLTDLSPNRAAFERASVRTAGLEFEPEPVDATRVPARLSGARTIFNGFHHLRPDLAREVLADAAEQLCPIGVFEIVARTPRQLLTSPLIALLVLLTTPFIRPFRLGRLFWTYLVPLVPLTTLWDGVASMLRVYSADELRALVADIEVPGYRWEVGHVDTPGGRVPYLLGLPE